MNAEKCTKCGYPVSRQRAKRWNRAQRPDGGYDHIDCHPGAPESKERRRLEAAQAEREHRRAVKLARARGEIL